MKFTCIALTILTILTLAQFSHAADKRHAIELGFLFWSYNYAEVWTPPAKSEESGFLPGFTLSYTYRGSSLPLFGRFTFEYTSSNTTYNGGLQNAYGGFTPLTNNTASIFKRIESVGGYIFRLGRNVTLAPYTGYGFREWRRMLAPGPGSYGEVYTWNYIPIGARGEYHLNEKWSFEGDISLRIMFGGGLDIRKDGWGNPSLTIGNKVGFKIAFPVTYDFLPNWAAVAEPWFETSGISQGDNYYLTAKNSIHEPESSTSIFGLRLIGQFRF